MPLQPFPEQQLRVYITVPADVPVSQAGVEVRGLSRELAGIRSSSIGWRSSYP